MNDKVTYHLQPSYCGKSRCRKCREGVGHGPYWYAYQTLDGHTTRTYVGKQLPPEARAMIDAENAENVADPSNPGNRVGSAISIHLTDLNRVSVRISVLGQFRLERRSGQQWQTVTSAAWQQQPVRALLGYLVSSPRRTVGRRQVIESLWPTQNEQTASDNLDRCVYILQHVLEPRALGKKRSSDASMEDAEDDSSRNPRGRQTTGPTRTSSQLLRTEGELLILADQSRVWVDADAFEGLITQAHAIGAEPLQVTTLLEEGAALYGGDFLPEERYAKRVITRRQALRRSWVGLLVELADLRIARGATSSAIDALDRLLAIDPTNEGAVQRLIVVLAQSQRRGEALRAYHRLVDVLQRDDIVPLEETRALYEAVRQGNSTAKFPGQQNDQDTDEHGGRLVSDHPSTHASQLGDSTQSVQIGRTNQSPLIGRDRELEVLRNLLLDVEQNARMQSAGQKKASNIPFDTQRHPQCVLLMGEAGIGKTRLAEEVGREAQRRGWTVLWSRVYAQESGIPYRLWTETLRKAMSQGTWQQQEVSKRPLIYQPLAALLPELEAILPSGITLAPEQEQLRLWEAMRELLKTISESTPLVIVLDDIQWSDGGSCELLGYLARHLHGYPILFIGTCRENELSEHSSHPLRSLVAHMQREYSVITLHIDPLTSEEIGALVSYIPNLPEPMVQHIQTQSAGNPFFAEELARTEPPTLPKTIAAALDHRMNRLSSPCQQLLGNAAVLGGSFEFPIICAMEVGGADEDTVLDLLEEAMQSGVLTEEGTGTRVTYQFWHPLLVSHLYDRISALRRTRLHQRAADVLQRMYQGRQEKVAATITHHLLKGGAEPLQIARYAELAGDRAYALSVYPEAERYYRLAVEHMEMGMRSTTHPDAALSDEQSHLVYLLERLAECTMLQGDFKEARRLYERILELRSLRHSLTPDGVSQYEAQVQALLWCEIGRTWRYKGDNAQAMECCERGEQVLRDAGVVAGPAWARLRYRQSNLYWQEGRYDEARRAAQEALSLFEQQQEPAVTISATPSITSKTRIQRILEGDPVDLGRTHTLLGALAHGMGLLTESLDHFNTALAIFEQYDHKREIAHVSCNLGYVSIKRGEYTLAQASLYRSLSLVERIGDTPLTSVVYSNLGELAASTGDLTEAEVWYKKSLALAERVSDREYMSMWNARLAAVLREQGKFSEAAACIRRALSISRAMHNAPCIGIALVGLGNMRIAQAQALSSSEVPPHARSRLLMHAREDIQRALALDGLEAETRTRGQLALAQISSLLGEVEPPGG